MRLVATIFAVLAVLAAAVGMYEALYAVANPATCSFRIGFCPASAEGTSYYSGFGVDFCAFVAGFFVLISGIWSSVGQIWRVLIVVAFILVTVLLPIFGGGVAAIYLGTMLPGYGALMYQILPLLAGAAFLQ